MTANHPEDLVARLLDGASRAGQGSLPADVYCPLMAKAAATIRTRDETIAAQAAALDALDQLLDDMGDDGLCVCQAAKDQAIAARRALPNDRSWS